MTYATTKTITPRTDRRMIACGTEVPDTCIQHAQTVIVTAETWHVIAPLPFRARFSREHTEIPGAITCPILDISCLPKDQDEEVAEVIGKYCTPDSGVTNLPALIGGLVALGAKVTNRPCAQCEGTTKHCDDCQFLEEGSDTSLKSQLDEAGFGPNGPQ